MVELSVVSNLLQQLLSIHNRVSLPGLGAFKVQYTPATFVDGGKKMSPPSKHIYFSSAEIWNDNLLENALSQEEGCGIEEAKELLAAFGRQMKQSLSNGQRIAFPCLGVLRLTDDQEYHFDAESIQQLNPESFGLLEIDMAPRPTVVNPPTVEVTPTIEVPPIVEVIPTVEVAPAVEVIPTVEITPPPVIINRFPELEPEPDTDSDFDPTRSYWWAWVLVIIAALVVCIYIFREPLRTVAEKAYYGQYYDDFLRDYKNK